MSLVLSLCRSLLLSTLISFATPILVLGGMLATLFLVSFIPSVANFGQIGANQVLEILTVFGSGCPVQGILIIAGAFAVVGSLFDLFNFYVYQGIRGH
jgi:hypothetical protein